MRTCLQWVFVLISVLLCCQEIDAQYSSVSSQRYDNSHFFYPNMDSDISQIRANAFPNLKFTLDDYLQYSSAVAMIITKAVGYESRSSWGRMAVSDLFSIGTMAMSVNGIKYTVKRMRPDGSSRNSFPSGHTATAFMMATMMHKEYGWRSPWFSIGAYTLATATSVMRIMNNRHWMSDTIAGMLIGVGSVYLGYFIADKIFGHQHLYTGYQHPEFFYDVNDVHYDIDLIYQRRHILGDPELIEKGVLPKRGSSISLNIQIPILVQAGFTTRMGIGSLVNHNIYNMLIGGYYTNSFTERWHLEGHLMAGYARITNNNQHNLDLLAGGSLALSLSRCFKLKVWAEFENIYSFRPIPALNSVLLGFSGAISW